MKTNDTIKVHLYDLHNKEIQTRNYDKVFRVYEKAGKLGIDWNTEKSPYTCKGDVFAPFETFAPSVIRSKKQLINHVPKQKRGLMNG